MFVVLNTVSALVNDIKAMSYTSMPATLAKATTGTATVPAAPMVPAMPLPPMTRLPVVGGVLMPAGTQPPPLQQMRLPAPPIITVQPRPARKCGAWEISQGVAREQLLFIRGSSYYSLVDTDLPTRKNVLLVTFFAL